jgi:preprotein translocase subunit SecD
MLACTRRAALVAVGLALALPVLAQDPPRPRVEFRRAETSRANGLVEAVVVGTTQKVYLHKTAELTGADVEAARVAGDARDASIEITFTDAGAKKAAKLSEGHADRPLAVLVEGKAIAAPVIRAKHGRTVRVTGVFTEQEAARLVKAINGR